METLLDRLSSGQIVAVISIVAGAIVLISMISAISKYQMQYLTEDTTLRREQQKADLLLRGTLVERRGANEKVPSEELMALGASEPAAENLDVQLAKRFGLLDTSAEVIEQTLVRTMATGPARKRLIIEVLDELLEAGAHSDAILAAIRPLCGSAKERPVEHAA
jgi:hypothetical protein